MVLSLAFSAKTSTIDVESQDIMPKTAMKLLNNLMPRSQTKRRVFTLSTQSPDMIKGTCFLKNALLIALFESGAMHTFIYFDCLRKLNFPLFSLPFDLLVSTPTRGKVSTSQTCLNCPILVEGKPFVVDLICQPLTGIDIIIGMDWLSSNDIIVDCSKKPCLFFQLSYYYYYFELSILIVISFGDKY